MWVLAVHRHDLQAARTRGVAEPDAAVLLRVSAVSFSLLFALPALSVRPLFLELDRKLGFHFFDAAHGGVPLLWQNLFSIFGHPEVYIIILPAFGIATSIIPAFARRRMLAFPLVALAEPGWSRSSASASGPTTCSRPASRPTTSSSSRPPIDGGDPLGDPAVRLDATVLAGQAPVQGAAALDPRLHRLFRDRGPLGDHVRGDPVQPGGPRHLLRGRPLPLRDLRRGRVPDPRRDLLLVPEAHRTHVPRGGGQAQLLVRCSSGRS